jgi:4-carboxymuconolactone decarboxylase
MTDYLPEIYQHFQRRFPTVKEAFDALGAAEHDAGPLAERERRLIKLGIAVGAESEGAVRSHVRKLLGIGVSEAEILHTIVLALTTIGFPATNAALSWAEEVLSEEGWGKPYSASGHEEFFRLYRRYAQAARMVQLSEESIVAGCEEVLEGLHWGDARAGTAFRLTLN